MKFLVQLFLLSVLCIGLSSCEDDQDVVDSTIIGRSWTGDVGMLDDFGMSVISTFSFGADGFGEEVQRYRNGEYCDSFRFQWWWEDSYSRNLVLDYGRYGGISYMDDVRVSGNQLWGTFLFSDDSPGFNFTLYME